MTDAGDAPGHEAGTGLEERLHAVESSISARKPAFYKDTSTIISMLALLFSFGTTLVSYHRTTEQDHHAMKVELREIYQRLAAIPKEGLEIYVKYKDNAAFYNAASASLAQENNLLALQAATIIARLPSDQVAAIDMYSLAVAQQNSRYFDNAIKSYEKAVSLADGIDVELGAQRGVAALKMATGHLSEGRADFQKALEIFTKYPSIDPYNQASMNIYTDVFWAGSEASIGQVSAAMQLLDTADEIAQRIQPGPNTDMVRAQILQQRQFIVSPNKPASTPALGPGSSASVGTLTAK